MADTNTNLPTYNGNLSQWLGRDIGGGDWGNFNSNLGYDASRSDYDFINNGNIYRLQNGTNGTRNISQTGTLSDRVSAQAELDRTAAMQPAIDSYKASIPETQQLYQTERDRISGEVQPLNDRYAKLLEDLNKTKDSAVTNTQRGFNQEMANRGISSDSGYYGQELARNVNPILDTYGSTITDANMNHEDAMRGISDALQGLVPKETADIRAINQLIANMTADTGNRNIDARLQTYAQNLQNDYQNRQATEEQRWHDMQNSLSQQQLKQPVTLSEGQSYFDPATGKVVYTAPKTAAPSSGSGSTANSLIAAQYAALQKAGILKGGATNPGDPSTWQATGGNTGSGSTQNSEPSFQFGGALQTQQLPQTKLKLPTLGYNY